LLSRRIEQAPTLELDASVRARTGPLYRMLTPGGAGFHPHSLKLFTARAANQILGTSGPPFWQDEKAMSVLCVTNGDLSGFVPYVENNPVTAARGAASKSLIVLPISMN
jgi:hypothetical protein